MKKATTSSRGQTQQNNLALNALTHALNERKKKYLNEISA